MTESKVLRVLGTLREVNGNPEVTWDFQLPENGMYLIKKNMVNGSVCN